MEISTHGFCYEGFSDRLGFLDMFNLSRHLTGRAPETAVGLEKVVFVRVLIILGKLFSGTKIVKTMENPPQGVAAADRKNTTYADIRASFRALFKFCPYLHELASRAEGSVDATIDVFETRAKT
ncbi:MAG: hypothetical protein VKM97_00980 [Cyanobacteriota bacterium]|nr:hypothetical protein [Cyanobacteriota bacterium]